MGAEIIGCFFAGFFSACLPAVICAVYTAFKRGMSLSVPDAD